MSERHRRLRSALWLVAGAVVALYAGWRLGRFAAGSQPGQGLVVFLLAGAAVLLGILLAWAALDRLGRR